MRLLSLQLTRYGNFTADRIAFDPRPGRVNLLFAPNGAGKSVLRQAISDLLFGIAGQTPMGFRFGYSGMRIAAEAIAPDGSQVSFCRRKGQGNTLVDAAGNADVSGTLARLLGEADRTLLERLFALDTERLRRGGEELLASGGAVGDALLAGGGLRGAKELRQSLDAAADVLAPAKRSAQKAFYRALDGLLDARRRANAALLRPDDWVRMEQDLATAETQQKEQNAAAAAQSARMAQLQRVRRVRVPMAERDAADGWLGSHPDAPVLAPSLEAKLADAGTKQTIAAQQLEREEGRCTELAAELAGITVDRAALATADEIDRLSEQAGAASKALTDLPKLDGEHVVMLARVSASLRRLGSTLPAERAAEVIPNCAAESRARALIAQYGAVAAAAEQAPAAITAATREIAEREAELAALPPPDGCDAVAPLLSEIRASGDPAFRADEVSCAVEESRAGLAAALACVPAWRGSADNLIGLTLLPAASYDRLDADRRSAEAERVRCMDRARTATEQHAQAARRLAAITGTGPVPDETAVAGARRHRDQGWQLIYRLAFTEDGPSAAEQQGFAGDRPLPLAYEHAVQAADGLADRRVLEADLIARAAEARRALAEAGVAVQEASASLAPAEQAAAEADRAWSEACTALAVGAAPGIDEVRSFLAARDRVIEQRRAVERDEQALARLDRNHAGWAERLTKALALVPAQTPTLAGLLVQAEDRLDAASRTTQQRIALDASLRELRRHREAAETALAEAQHKLARWRADWETAMIELGRPAAEHPAVTADILALLAELDQEQKDATQLYERLRAMRADNTAFTEAVAVLLVRTAPELSTTKSSTEMSNSTTDMLAALRALRERLQDHRARATRCAELQKMLDQAGPQVAQLQHRLAQRQTEHQHVLMAIGAATVEDAEQRLAASRDRVARAEALAQAEARLREDGDGLSIGQLRDELAALPADDIPAALTAAAATMSAANDAAQDAAARASRQKLQMDQRAADIAHETAIADQQAAVATIDRVLEEAMLSRLASGLLGRAMEAVETQGGSALLARVSQYFRTLSGGAYDRIIAEDNGCGGLALAMVPSDVPHEQKRVKELSEGTRDQLYLALRLAAIEDHVSSAPPLPFIGDDILQTSDDARATLALRALVALSHHVQIILLTHHPHILRLASSLPAETVHVCRITSGVLTVA